LIVIAGIRREVLMDQLAEPFDFRTAFAFFELKLFLELLEDLLSSVL
jgi:hypothetical protein